MKEEKRYSLDEISALLANLENCRLNETNPGPNEEMATRLKEKVKVNGQDKWISGYSRQELLDSYVKLLVKEGIVEMVEDDDAMPAFGKYLDQFYATFKQGQEKNTVVNRERIIRNHIKPAYGDKRIDRISTMELQRWFNELGKKYSRETLLKIKNVMSPVFDAAVEDEIITRNPLASKRLNISGKETVSHKAIPKEKMKQIREGLESLEWREKAMGGLLAYTGMRYEEVLGVKWEDISDEWITVRRAVVHPNRNMPEVKKPKTKTSERQIPMTKELKALLGKGYKHGYLLAAGKDKKRETPMSYTEARRVFDKIRRRFSIEDYSAHDFRDTCATEWREKGIPLDVIARMLGHSKTETTEKRYVKYRTEIMDEARKLM